MAFVLPGGRRRPTGFRVLDGFDPTNLPAPRLQFFNNGFPILRHVHMKQNLASRSKSEEAGVESLKCSNALMPKAPQSADKFQMF